MKSICLVLTSPRGDELGRLRLGNVAVAAAGERGATERPSLTAEMEALGDRIQSTMAGEGMTVGLDPVDFRIAISRALLQESDQEEIQIVLPVLQTLPADGGVLDPEEPAEGQDPFSLDHLFPLDEFQEEIHETEG
jgi:hypothetical protein